MASPVILESTWTSSTLPPAARRPWTAWALRLLACAMRHAAVGAQHTLVICGSWTWQPHHARAIAASRRAHEVAHRAHHARRPRRRWLRRADLSQLDPETYSAAADDLSRRAREIDRQRHALWASRIRRMVTIASLLCLLTVVPWMLPIWQPWPRIACVVAPILLLPILGRIVADQYHADVIPSPQEPIPSPDAGLSRHLMVTLARHLPAAGITVQQMGVRPVPGGHAVHITLDPGLTVTDVRRRLPSIASRLMVPAAALTVVAHPRDPQRVTLEIVDGSRGKVHTPEPAVAPQILEHLGSVLAGVDPGLWTEHIVEQLAAQHGTPYADWLLLPADKQGRQLADAIRPFGLAARRLPRIDGEQRRGLFTAEVMSVLREHRLSA
jgi:hypothetical protein